jgi:hypothetical protein
LHGMHEQAAGELRGGGVRRVGEHGNAHDQRLPLVVRGRVLQADERGVRGVQCDARDVGAGGDERPVSGVHEQAGEQLLPAATGVRWSLEHIRERLPLVRALLLFCVSTRVLV